MMTKRNFELIATVLRIGWNRAHKQGPEVMTMVSDMIEAAIRLLIHENPHFDAERFRRACKEAMP